jgi:hypothetical protein
VTIAVRAAAATHGRVRLIILEKPRRLGDDPVALHTDEPHGTARRCLWSFGHISHHQHGRTENWCLLLNASRVGQDHTRAGHE